MLIIDEVNKINNRLVKISKPGKSQGKSAKPSPVLKYSAENVAELFILVIPQAMRLFREEMRENRSGLHSIPQFRILAQLSRDPLSNKELAERIGVSWAAMSRMVDSLAAEGLVEREKSQEDRRQITIHLTKKGQIYFSKVRKGAMSSLAERLTGLSEDVMNQIGLGLSHVSKGLSQLRK